MRHLLNPLDFSVEEIEALLDLASDIEKHPQKYAHVCDGKKISHSVLRAEYKNTLKLRVCHAPFRRKRTWLFFRGFQLCRQGRERFRHHPRYFLLCRYLRHAPPQGGPDRSVLSLITKL